MTEDTLSYKDRLRRLRLADESFIRSYTKHAKPLPALSPQDQAVMEAINAEQRELKRERLLAIYADHEE